MNKLKKLLIFIFCAIFILYLLFLTVVPLVFSSHLFLDAVDDIIAERFGVIIKSKNLNVATTPTLLINISSNAFSVNYQQNELLKVQNGSLVFDIKRLKPKNINIDYIYLNNENIENINKTQKSKKTPRFKLKNLPEINIKLAQIHLKNGEKIISADINNLQTITENNRTKITFSADIVSNFMQHKITAGENGYLYFENSNLYANNLDVLIGQSAKLKINGKIIGSDKKREITIKGKDIPVSYVMSTLLYLQKMKDKSKKFIENFYDYSGTLQVDIKITENGIFGNCEAINLAGKSVIFNVPILFKYVPFKFSEREFYGGAYGTLGGEKVYADFKVTNIMTPNLESKGSVHSVLTKRLVEKYIPNASLNGEVDASVHWHIKNKIVDVNYNLDIPTESDIFYQNVHLGLIDKQRKIYVETLKKGDKLEITDYYYAMNDNKRIITGKGMFTKQNDNFTPDYITLKTVNEAPVSLAGSFYKYITGGVFYGDLKYDFHLNKITGHFNIKDSIYKNYEIREADVIANSDKITVKADGKYQNSPFNAGIEAKNDFNNKIHIYNLNLFLDELVVKRPQRKKNNDIKIDEKLIKKQTDNFDIELFSIKLNKIKYIRAILTDIQVNGSIKDNVFKFNVPNITFAKGKITAEGFYDFNKRVSDVTFLAKNIYASIAADTLFNLPNQIMGIANAKLEVKTKNGIEDKNAHVEFNIKEGYLPKLGSKSFMIRHKAFTLNDIVNVNLENMKDFASNLNGKFDIHNEHLKDINIISSQKYLSLMILGDYDRRIQNADFSIFGQYNIKRASKIKIFFIPLSFVIKILFRNEKAMDLYKEQLCELPEIKRDSDKDVRYFRISVKGNLNKNNFQLEMKNIL